MKKHNKYFKIKNIIFARGDCMKHNYEKHDYEELISLNNERYHWGCDDVDKVLKQNNYRTIQLSTVAKLTTDNQSIIKDFPIKKGSIGACPYKQYCIKVADTEGTILYILVSQHGKYVNLLPIVSGFKQGEYTDVLHLTSNWRAKSFDQPENNIHNKTMVFGFEGFNGEFHDTTFKIDGVTFGSDEDFDIKNAVVIKINTENGIYNRMPFVFATPKKSLFDAWFETEEISLTKHLSTAPSTTAMIIQVWLHTIALWREKCINRSVVIKNDISNTVDIVEKIDDYKPKSKYHIIDISKDIVIYENRTNNIRKFLGYHMTETDRCGHFRHLSNGKIIYIKPTTVRFKKILPDAFNGLSTKIIYRNTEDFLKEKSYLEYEILEYLRENRIRYEREKNFHWLGKKRLDFYLPDLNVAIECQGVQHFYKYGSDDTELEYRQKRDKDKFNQCVSHDIKLFYYKNENIPLPTNIEHKQLYFEEIKKLFDTIMMYGK